MNEELNQLPQSLSFAIKRNRQYLNLQPYVKLAQHIMDAPVCEIHITDTQYKDTVAHHVDEAVYKGLISYNAISKNGSIYEIENLADNKSYKDHSYVKNSPCFQYLCSAKLTTNSGRYIGYIYVLDNKVKSVSNKQKDQLQNLALLVANAIEYENRYRNVASKLAAMHESFDKLNHDLRSPISGIVGISDFLIEENEHVAFPTKELIMIKESAETILDMIDKVLEGLDFKNRGSESEEQEKIRFDHIVEQLKRLFYPPSKAKGVSLTFVNQVDPGLTVSRSFSLKLLQITSNLLSNAVKFTSQHGAVEITLTQDTDKNKNILNITVEDNGQGMTAKQIAAFNNGAAVTRSAGTNGEQSFGVGLEHVKKAVARVGGTISVKTGGDQGTQFLISIPIPIDNFSRLMSSLSLLDKAKPTTNGIK